VQIGNWLTKLELSKTKFQWYSTWRSSAILNFTGSGSTFLPSDRFCDVALYTRSKSDANILFLGEDKATNSLWRLWLNLLPVYILNIILWQYRASHPTNTHKMLYKSAHFDKIITFRKFFIWRLSAVAIFRWKFHVHPLWIFEFIAIVLFACKMPDHDAPVWGFGVFAPKI